MFSVSDEKLIELFYLIERSCNSSVRIFNVDKGHTSRSVGYAAFEERQKKLRDLATTRPDIIEHHCKIGSYDYFKFEGRTLKIVSSSREVLASNVFEKNRVEVRQEEFDQFDPLLRIIYKADYDLDAHEASILECHFLVIDRRTEVVLHEVNLLQLAIDRSGAISEVASAAPDAVELPAGGLLKSIDVEAENSED